MIRKVLIANRGEIAIRISYTLREMGIEAAAVFTAADEGALHAHLAREAHLVTSYLDIDEMIRTATDAAADAIHPGYGFLSENAALSAACAKAGIVFIGPAPETIRRMGDKLESKCVMQEAGVPVVPIWEGEPPDSEYPVLVKAAGGGGGKGMRLVERPADLAGAMASASREAAAAFGDSRVFVEKYIRHPRHIEFQILGDSHGNYLHVFERECSIQRRHQKIIEETPSTAVTSELRAQMGAAALAAARAAKYRGAGTVEFILDPVGRFYFLEMNTRLQVEHPVTELTTGLDLVRLQLLVAAGRPLPAEALGAVQRGHAIEARLYAEDPERGYLPAAGRLATFDLPAVEGVRVDAGVAAGSDIPVYYDPLLAKVIARGDTREEAAGRLAAALAGARLHGVATN